MSELKIPVESPAVQSPPPAPQPPRQEIDPRARLHQLAGELAAGRNRRLLIEYLRLRRSAR